MPNFSFLDWFSYSSTVSSFHQLLTADESWNEKNLTEIFMYTLKVIYMPNFGSLGWFLISSTFISCHQLLTAVDSWWQLIWIKFDWNFHVHSIGDIFAKFQLSRLIFIFISFWQLLSAVDSWWQLSRKKINWNFHLPPKYDIHAKFELSRLLGSQARECDGRTPPDGRQKKLGLTQALLGLC